MRIHLHDRRSSNRFAWWAMCAILALSGCFGRSDPPAEPPDPQTDPSAQPANAPATTADGTDLEWLNRVEQIEQRVSSQLKKVVAWFEQGYPEKRLAVIDAQATEALVAPPLDREMLKPARNGAFSVRRLEAADRPPSRPTSASAAWRSLLAPIEPTDPTKTRGRHAKFKVFRVEPDGDRVRTRVLLSAALQIPNQSSQELNATLQLVWNAIDDDHPKLESIRVEQYETATYTGESTVALNDCTQDWIGDEPELIHQFGHGTEYWIARMMQSDYSGHFGLAIGDANGDGLDDLYVCQDSGLPNRLLLQTAEGGVRDISAEAGVDILDPTRSALFIDIDNDGDQDLLAVADAFLLVLENPGDPTREPFRLKAKLFEARSAYSLSAADYDRDGDLDVYACRYSTLFGGGPFPFAYPFHDANNGGQNVLYQNDGQGNFRDVTQETGLDQDNHKFSFAAAWEDFDLDGDPDLYVANDFGRNVLYENREGHFVNVADQVDVEDQSFGMSVDWADVNHDGRPDLYVSNMFSSAGNRLSFQREYLSHDPALRSRARYMARGNSLFLGAADRFEDVSLKSNVWMGRWAWGSLFADLDNDSWDDVLVANGYLTRNLPDDL